MHENYPVYPSRLLPLKTHKFCNVFILMILMRQIIPCFRGKIGKVQYNICIELAFTKTRPSTSLEFFIFQI